MRQLDLCDKCRAKVRSYGREAYALRQLRRGATPAWWTSSAPAARRLRSLRADGWTYKALAEKVDVPITTLHRAVKALDRGEPRKMRSDVAARILEL